MKFNDDFRKELYEAIKTFTASRYNNPGARVKITTNHTKAGVRTIGYKITCEACGEEVIRGDNRARTCSERCRKELSRNRQRYKKWLRDYHKEVQQFLQAVLEV